MTLSSKNPECLVHGILTVRSHSLRAHHHRVNVTTLPIVTPIPIYVSDTHQSMVTYWFTVRTLPYSVADLHKTDKKFHGKSSRVHMSSWKECHSYWSSKHSAVMIVKNGGAVFGGMVRTGQDRQEPPSGPKNQGGQDARGTSPTLVHDARVHGEVDSPRIARQISLQLDVSTPLKIWLSESDMAGICAPTARAKKV